MQTSKLIDQIVSFNYPYLLAGDEQSKQTIIQNIAAKYPSKLMMRRTLNKNIVYNIRGNEKTIYEPLLPFDLKTLVDSILVIDCDCKVSEEVEGFIMPLICGARHFDFIVIFTITNLHGQAFIREALNDFMMLNVILSTNPQNEKVVKSLQTYKCPPKALSKISNEMMSVLRSTSHKYMMITQSEGIRTFN